MGHQQFCDITAQFPYPVRTGLYYHTFLHIQSAGSSNPGTAVHHMLHDTEPACADIGKVGDMAQVRNADAIFNCGVEHACAFNRVNDSSVYGNVDIFQHLDTSFSQATQIASNLHSLRQMPHLRQSFGSITWTCFLSPEIAP